MRVLLDTQAVIWYVDQDHLLSPAAHAVITDPNNDLLLSAAAVWETAIKVGLGKLTLSLPYRAWMYRTFADLSLSLLPVTIEYADVQATLPGHHRDPFDRLMIAQALTEGIPIVSADPLFDPYGVQWLW